MAKKETSGEALALAVHELLRRVRFDDVEAVCSWGITRTECHTLEVVALHGPLSVNEIAGRIRLNKSTASRVVQSLQKKKLIGRRDSENDGRSIEVSVTAKGKSLWQEIVRSTSDTYDDVLEDCSDSERAAVTKVLRRIAERVGRS